MDKTLALVSINVMLIMFFLAGVDKVRNFNKVVTGFMKRVPVTPVWIAYVCITVAIIIELVAPVIINYGFLRKDKTVYLIGCVSLIIFTILATLIYHFPPTGFRYYPFMSNLTTIGGLMLASAYTAR